MAQKNYFLTLALTNFSFDTSYSVNIRDVV